MVEYNYHNILIKEEKMNINEVMQELQNMGTEQNRKIYKRHGAGDNQFGVSFANFKLLKKKIKLDHDLAIQLWETENTDARIFSTMIIDHTRIEEETIDTWIKEIDYYGLLDQFIYNVVAKSQYADKKLKQWLNSEDEWIGRGAWDIVIHKAMNDKDIEDDYFEELLIKIKENIHQSKNRKKESMNNALITIGLRNEALEKKAIEVAEVIGKVQIDHGDTSCKTPSAVEYINKAKKRKN